jgi:seryl-tRNA synthetase
MYDIKWIREHPEDFDRGLTRRGLEKLSAKLIALDEKRRAAITKFEQAQARRNSASKEIGDAKKKKDEAGAQRLMAEVAELKVTLPALEDEQKKLGDELDKELAQIPNLPADDVPEGKDEHGNIEHHVVGKKRDYSFKPKQHFELGEALGMMDFELAAKLSGARFVVLQKGLARLERALGQLFLDVHTSEKHGYTEVNPPLLVRDDVMFGTAQLPKFAEDQFSTVRMAEFEAVFRDVISETFSETAKSIPRIVEQHKKETGEDIGIAKAFELLAESVSDDIDEYRAQAQRELLGFFNLWLIPTAEVPLTNLVRESIVDEDSLPRRYTACTPCFRAEAGAAGKDTRGMIRQHQFTKVELVSIVTADKSKEEHERMLACAEEVLKKLDLHYRVVTLCTGDMGFAAQKTYDIEVWLPGQNMYREISSCSNCGEFQARRMNARYRGKDGKPAFVHTLNGSGVAVGRALIAVMETYQDEQGAIVVPEALQQYMGGLKKIERG